MSQHGFNGIPDFLGASLPYFTTHMELVRAVDLGLPALYFLHRRRLRRSMQINCTGPNNNPRLSSVYVEVCHQPGTRAWIATTRAGCDTYRSLLRCSNTHRFAAGADAEGSNRSEEGQDRPGKG